MPEWNYSNHIGCTLKAVKISNCTVCFSVLTLGNTVVLEVLEGMAAPAANFCGSALTMRLFFKT